jgi:CheY-like chemotaxis protein
VLATLRADPMLAGIPVVVLTAKSLTEAERQFLSRSAVRVLQKGEPRLADVAALVLRAAVRAGRGAPPDGDQLTTTSTSAGPAAVSR